MAPKKMAGTTAALAKAIAKAVTALELAEAELDAFDLAQLTADERVHSNGRLRDGEHAAMVNVLDTVDAFPERFAAIAAHDHGVDDEKVETAPARDALSRFDMLAPLRATTDRVASKLGDDALASAGRAKDVTGPAYAIIKANAALDPALRKKAAVALNFYAKTGKKRAPKP